MRLKFALLISVSGVFLILDRFLKWQALHGWSAPRLVHKWFGWQPFLNPGVAFGIPLPSWLIILLTVPIIILLIYHVVRIRYQANESKLGYVLCNMCYAFIIAGALSNLIDRIIYGKTVDYILIFTGVINAADVLIVFGFLLYLLYSSNYVPQTKFSRGDGPGVPTD